MLQIATNQIKIYSICKYLGHLDEFVDLDYAIKNAPNSKNNS